jgi:hypothetical protein
MTAVKNEFKKNTAATDGLIGAVHGYYVYMGCVQ